VRLLFAAVLLAAGAEALLVHRLTRTEAYELLAPKPAAARETPEHMARELAWRAAAPVLLLAPLLLAAVWLAVRRATRPILGLRDQVAGRAAADLTPLDTGALPDEVRPLVEELNLLFARLERAFQAQREFVADAAHELRTPLAALRLQTQVLQRAADGEERAQAAARLLQGVDRATRLVEQLLLLARQEAAAEPAPRAGRIELAELAALALGDVLPAARLKDIDLGLAPGAQAAVAGPEEPLRLLLGNLLENAVKYAPPGGTVDLAVRVEGDRAVLTVADDGPGIAPADRERVFDRFRRLPGQDAPGSGLGLAIVKAAAERCGGQVVLGRSDRLGGLEASVFLPLAPPAEGKGCII
jgi:two-component system OmpR family sensor kinase